MRAVAHLQLVATLDRFGRSRAVVARSLGIHESHLSKICKGERRPSLELAAAIERLTYGAVRCIDWVPVDEPELQAAS